MGKVIWEHKWKQINSWQYKYIITIRFDRRNDSVDKKDNDKEIIR